MATVKVTQSAMLRMALRELSGEDRSISSVDIHYHSYEWYDDDQDAVRREHTGKRTITIVTEEK